ncbi:hypothetical protein P872_05355 [Rhodonellum psychrophilum GCM71 = DSM 17998]|uniref:DUF4286 domain-containing protein n=2 Tax=Rhodonellum TaxID=336827 RepID=U5C1U4_9BACT|nr:MULTISPECIES: DUF4286 family protein [Rhodonellum]ERM82876.1 hypothetical protein P872_05355 [Rhodonellum psychrophilum GCM71 = DSM 17998]SDY46835.1 protein of unknown function [Rhodonellum ikkaensis]
MILYNITVNIEKQVEQEWILWMKEVHIPDVLATGIFHENKFYKLLHETDDGTVNYSIQYFTDSMEKISEYNSTYAPKLQSDFKAKFEDKYVVFRSLLEIVK